MRCTLKYSFKNLVEYIIYRQEKDEEFFVLFFFASAASAVANAVILLSICFATLSSIYLPYGKFDITSLAVGFDMIFANLSRAKHISSPYGHIEHEMHIDRRRRISMRSAFKGTTPSAAVLFCVKIILKL